MPIVTTAYLPSAACDAYWPEIYWDQSLANESLRNPYTDTLAPKVFPHTSPPDPELFSTPDECAQEMLDRKATGKYSPLEVAEWLEGYAAQAEAGLDAQSSDSPAVERAAIDIRIQAGLGRFFAHKFRAAVWFAVFQKTNARSALGESLHQCQAARACWETLAAIAAKTYAADLSVSDRFDERGQWTDQLPNIEVNLEQIAAVRATDDGVPVQELLRPKLNAHHTPATRVDRGSQLSIRLSSDEKLNEVILVYRHVNQAEHYERIPMMSERSQWAAVIPANYIDSPFAIQYYFVLRTSEGATLYPGLGPNLTGQPYFVVE